MHTKKEEEMYMQDLKNLGMAMLSCSFVLVWFLLTSGQGAKFLELGYPEIEAQMLASAEVVKPSRQPLMSAIEYIDQMGPPGAAWQNLKLKPVKVVKKTNKNIVEATAEPR
jgi:hypothetical protein